MKIVITHAPPDGGGEYHKQKLYHVPRETAQQMASDFQAFQQGSGRVCEIYDYALTYTDSHSESEVEAEDSEPVDMPDGGEPDGEESDDEESDDVLSGDSEEDDSEDDTSEDGDSEDSSVEASERGFVVIDFRTVAAIQGYDD